MCTKWHKTLVIEQEVPSNLESIFIYKSDLSSGVEVMGIKSIKWRPVLETDASQKATNNKLVGRKPHVLKTFASHPGPLEDYNLHFRTYSTV